MTADEPKSELLRRLLADAGEAPTLTSSYSFLKRPLDAAEPLTPLVALGIPDAALSDRARLTLEAVEELAVESRGRWESFRWKLTAFQHVQDILDAPLYDGESLQNLFKQHYFYYESQALLAESFLASLNGLHAAAAGLLRPFLEFSIFQNYYVRRREASRSYAAFETFLRQKRPPTARAALSQALPSDEFCKPIRLRVGSMMEGLSVSTAHVYQPEHSRSSTRRGHAQHRLDDLYFWFLPEWLLDAVLWMYFANNPLLFHPVDVLAKFGFNGPVGVFADAQVAHAVRKSLSPQDYQAFAAYGQGSCKDTLEWATSRPELEESAIRDSWDRSNSGECPTNLDQAYAQHMARFRLLRLAMAWQTSDELHEVDEASIFELGTLDGWRRVGRKHRHR